MVQVPVKRRTDNYKLGEFSSRSPISRKAAQQIEPVSDICIVASFYYCRIFYFSTKLPTNYYTCKYSIDFFHENRPKPLKTGTFFFKNKGKGTYFLVKTTRITQKENKQQKRPRLQIGISAYGDMGGNDDPGLFGDGCCCCHKYLPVHDAVGECAG